MRNPHTLVALLLVFAFACFAQANDQEFKLGKEVYEKTCHACHGKDGKGMIPGTPNFTTKNNPLFAKEESLLVKNIMEGFQSKGSVIPMPAKGGDPTLTKQQAIEVVKYLKQRFKQK